MSGSITPSNLAAKTPMAYGAFGINDPLTAPQFNTVLSEVQKAQSLLVQYLWGMVNVLDFVSNFNGSTISSDDVNNAIVWAVANGRHSVYVPDGLRVNVTSSIGVPQDTVLIGGSGSRYGGGATVACSVLYDTATPLIWMKGGGCGLVGFNIDADGYTNSNRLGVLIDHYPVTASSENDDMIVSGNTILRCKLVARLTQNLRLFNNGFDGMGSWGTEIYGGLNSIITNNVWYSCGNNGGAGSIKVDNYTDHTGQVWAASDLRILGNTIYYGGRSYIDNDYNPQSASGAVGVSLNNCKKIQIAHNQIYHNPCGVRVGAGTFGCSVVGNTFGDTAGRTIDVQDAGECYLKIMGNTHLGTDGQDNEMGGGSNEYINIGGVTSKVQVLNETMHAPNSRTVGVVLEAGTSKCHVDNLMAGGSIVTGVTNYGSNNSIGTVIV